MIECQKDKFSLPLDITYLNNAYMSPILNSGQLAGIEELKKKSNPSQIVAKDFFNNVAELKKQFAKLIHAQAEQIAIIPSASYGISTVTNNLKAKPNGEIVVIDEQFPSNYYPWQAYAKRHNQLIKVIKVDKNKIGWQKQWNDDIAKSINSNTTAVALGHVHWSDGTLYNLKHLRKITKDHQAELIIDGSQSIGALPLYIDEIEVDALITVGYKWLLGHYGMGLAYYSPSFNNGTPIEDNWINKKDSHEFQNLVNYVDEYEPGAAKYSMGGQSNFIHVAIMLAGLEQILEWGVENIQAYCKKLHRKLYDNLKNSNYIIADPNHSASHLIGIRLKENMDINAVKSKLKSSSIFVSYRGDSLRVSLYMYNDSSDVDKLSEALLSI